MKGFAMVLSACACPRLVHRSGLHPKHPSLARCTTTPPRRSDCSRGLVKQAGSSAAPIVLAIVRQDLDLCG